MKIGILTYHRSNNVGALLQNYALIHKLSEIGHNVETIDYKCALIEHNNRFFAKRNLKESIKLLIQLFPFVKRERLFNRFRHKYINLSKEVYDKNSISESISIYDAFITGSDQVWNLNINNEDYTYFLDFVPISKYRLSYAGSFGYSKLPKRFEQKTIDELKKFSCISVREESAKDILSTFGIYSTVVLDPTLLLTGEQWRQNFGIHKKYSKKFIFVYLVAYTPELLSIAHKRAEKEGLELWVMHYNYRLFPKCKNITAASPLDFLHFINEAEIVYCSSFHAMCFSILFKKNFYYSLDKSKVNNNSRLETLAKSLNLSHRNIDKLNNRTIDYNEVDSLLIELRNSSLEYLKSINTINS